MSEIHNNLLKRRLQTKLAENIGVKLQFKNVSLCGSKVPPASNGVVLARRLDKPDAKFIGLTHCGNAWLCPTCAPRVCVEQGKRIAAALEITRSNNLKAYMMTLTIGHCRGIPLGVLLDTLDKCWKLSFAKRAKHITGGFKLVKEFHETVQIKHFVKACELMWSYEYGWHPHYHVLVWAENFDKVIQFEERLNEMWLKLTETYLLKALSDYPETLRNTVKRVYALRKARTVGIFFSKDAHGNLTEQKSSSYISGWGANKELADAYSSKTSNFKGHFNLMEILEKAVVADEDGTDSEFWWQLYLDAAKAVFKKHARFAWSHTGLKAAAMQYLSTLTEEQFQKKFMHAAKSAEWQTVAYFPSILYERLLQIDDFARVEIEILHYARDGNFGAICELTKKLTGYEPLKDSPFKLKNLKAAA